MSTTGTPIELQGWPSLERYSDSLNPKLNATDRGKQKNHEERRLKKLLA
jgi:hypothetical protein